MNNTEYVAELCSIAERINWSLGVGNPPEIPGHPTCCSKHCAAGFKSAEVEMRIFAGYIQQFSPQAPLAEWPPMPSMLV